MRNRAGIETRERILGATQRLLAERGLDGVTIKGICDAADVHAGSFYNLFDSKEQVVLTAVREAITAVDPDSESAQAFRSIAERIAVELKPKKIYSPELKIL